MPLYTRFEKYNNANEHEHDPYVISIEGVLLIDKTWWQSLTITAQKQITAKTALVQLVDCLPIPHVLCPPHDALTTVYWTYLQSFDYQCWYSPNIPNGPKDVVLIQLTAEDKASLNVGETNSALKSKLEAVCCCGKKYFVRLSGTSGKNERSVRPFQCAQEILDHLARIQQFRVREYSKDKETFLILIPWNDAIDARCEFRVFVVNGKLTAASPQKFWELQQYSCEELEAIQSALSTIAFLDYFLQKTFVADVYIDITTAICHLIELNPFGAHCGAGASFFNWIDDDKILCGHSPPELRYLSAINF